MTGARRGLLGAGATLAVTVPVVGYSTAEAVRPGATSTLPTITLTSGS